MTGEYTKYQQKVINNYYQNIDTIALQRLQEMITELYLVETDKKKEALWQRVHKAMINIKVHPDIINHIMTRRDVQVLARNVEQWQKKK